MDPPVTNDFLLDLASQYGITSLGAADLLTAAPRQPTRLAAEFDISASSRDSSSDRSDHGFSISEFSDSASTSLDGSGDVATALATSSSAIQQAQRSHARQVQERMQQEIDSLRRQLVEKDNQMQQLQVQHSQAVTHFEGTKARLKQALNDANKQAELTKQRLQEESKARSAQIEAELALLRSRLEQVEQESPYADIKTQTLLLKNTLRHLDVSESLYLEYKAIPEERQTISEFVAVRVFELVNAEKQARQALMKEMDSLRESAVESQEEARVARRELQIAHERSRTRELEVADDRKQLDHVVDTLSAKLADTQAALIQAATKAEQYDKLQQRYDDLSSQHTRLSKEHTIASSTLESVSKQNEDISRRLTDCSKQLDLLKLDKMYLSKEVQDLTKRLEVSEQNNDRLGRKVGDLKRVREDLTSQLLSARDEFKTSYSQQMDHELKRMKEESAAQLELIRSNQRDVYDQQISSQREELERAREEIQTARQKLQATQDKYTHLLEDYHRLQAQADTAALELTNQLKIKTFEFQRLSVLHDECTEQLQKTLVDNDTLKQKNDVLHTEYHKLEVQYSKDSSRLESRLHELTQRLNAYEQLERELDVAILQAGSLQGGDDAKHGSEEALRTGGLVGIIGSAMPTASKRRIEQSIILARQLVDKQRAIEKLQQTVQRTQDTCKQLTLELSEAKHQLSSTQQPYKYLVSIIQQKDAELSRLHSELESLQESHTALEKQHSSALRVQHELKEDIQRLAANEEQLKKLRNLVFKLRAQLPVGKPSGASKQPLSSRPPHNKRAQDSAADNNRSTAPGWLRKLQQKKEVL